MNDNSDQNGSCPDVDDVLETLDVCRSLVRNSLSSIVSLRFQMVGFEIFADCDLGGERLSDFLNQSLSEYVDCTHAKLYRSGQLVECIDRLKIRKPEIVYAGLAGPTHEAREKQIGNRRQLNRFAVFLVVDQWMIKGCVHLKSKITSNAFLSAEREFFPVQNAQVAETAMTAEIDHLNVAIVNRQKVSVMEMMECTESESEITSQLLDA